ncbi:MAG: hypothetical protein WBF04_03860 [Candidatus Sulfotelmatobacter sp.]
MGLEYDESEIRFVLSNASDKPVVAVIIGRVDIVPRGCTVKPWTEPYRPVKNFSADGFKVNIKPRDQGAAARAGIIMIGTAPPAPGYPHYPKREFHTARWAEAAYVEAQFGITGVFFADGTAWPAQIAFLMHDDFDPSHPSPAEITSMSALHHADPFDRSLAEGDDAKCTDVVTVTNALDSVKEVVFEHEGPEVPNRGDIADALPHLHFTCRLAGPKAICQLPVETNHRNEPQARLETDARE